MASYKARLERDLDRWIAQGLTPAASRQPILDSVADSRRLDASTALAAVGGLLLGIAVIAFVAANWGVIPRLARFVMILLLFLGVGAGAAWAARGERPVLRDTLLLVAALIYAAAIGLTGQIFDIAGDPQTALRGAGLAAALLAVAGRSAGAGVAALLLLALGDLSPQLFDVGEHPAPWLAYAAPLGLVLAWVWRSRPMAHAAAIALPLAVLLLMLTHERDNRQLECLAAAVGFAALAGAMRWRAGRGDGLAAIVYGWAVWSALIYFASVGIGDHDLGRLAHRGVWLVLSGGVIALGLLDRQGAITAAGILSLAAAGCVILFDLGLGLLTAAGVFGACALVVLAAGWLLRRRARS